MSEHEQTEIGTKLVLEDHAKEALHHLSEGFEHLQERVHEVTHEMMGMAKQAAAVAIGFQLSGGIESVKELGEEIFESAAHLANQKKELAGAISMVEKGETSFGELTEAADHMNERFENLAISTGNTKDSMLDAFEMIASRSTRSADEVEEMTGKMAVASKNLPGGLAAMSAAWRDLETGIVRPKNALIQLMRQTGVVEGGAKKVSKALNSMLQNGKQEDVFKLAETAIDRMAAKMKDAPLTFDQLMVSLKTTRESFYETMGAPMIKALVPELEHLKGYLAEHREEIERLAHTMGDKVGEWVKIAGADIKEAFEYLETHSDQIAAALEGGAHAIKEAVGFVAEHRDLLLGLAAAKYGGGAILGAAGGLAKMAPGLGAAAGKAVGAGAFGATGGAGVAIAMAAPLAAVAAWTAAAYHMGKLEEETGLSMTRIVTTGTPGELFAASDRLANVDAVVRRIGEDSLHVDATDAAMKHYMDTLEQSGYAAVAAGDMTLDAFHKVMAQAQAQASIHERLASAGAGFSSAAAEIAASDLHKGVGTSSIAHAYGQLSAINQTAADKFASDSIRQNNVLRIALAGVSGTVEEALKRLKASAGVGGDGPDVKLPPINFGPTTMHIHQDFRNVDPDRIALVFEKGIARSATNRISSRLSSPFGF